MRNAAAALRDSMGFRSQSHLLAAKLVRFGLVGGRERPCLSGLHGIARWLVRSGSQNGFGRRLTCLDTGEFRWQPPILIQIHGAGFGRFLPLHGCNILLTMAAMGAAVGVLRLHFAFGAAAAVVLVPLVSFAAMILWVFRRTPSDPPTPTQFVN
jgi:hypothetical protein